MIWQLAVVQFELGTAIKKFSLWLNVDSTNNIEIYADVLMLNVKLKCTSPFYIRQITMA
jgi:hypothetical protein